MKKILSFLLLAVSLTTSAQDIYSISKPLKLGNVASSESLSDSVLVYTSGKMVKTAPRSEFSIQDATSTLKGKIKLAGDLSGTADLPTVPGLANKQDNLVSGANIKTINGASILGSGNLDVGGSSVPVSATVSGIVNNTSLQELGGVDKLIHGVRVGTGASTTAQENTILGVNVLNFNTTGSYNAGVGFEALMFNTTGSGNATFGNFAQRLNTTGTNNAAFGPSALEKNQFGNGNVAIGPFALYKNVGTAGSNVYGHRSVAVGNNCMAENTTGNGTAVGEGALSKQTTGTWNITVGSQAGSGITIGTSNTIIAGTGFVTAGGGITTGSNNLILAQNNGNTTGVTTGSGNTIVGKVTGLAAALANTVIVSDGVGTQRLISDATNLTTLPAQTMALIIADSTGKAITNKDYVDNGGAVVNASTSALSGTSLTSTYPNALLGFRVQCLSVAGGGLVYEKTTGGWIQYSATTVAP